jgi:hypothetical protein
MHWLLSPFDKHSDDGFGAIGDAFSASAEVLLSAEKDSLSHREVPICFMLRHAVELYLKSALVVSYRALEKSEGYPSILDGGKNKPLTAVHGVGPLYRQLIEQLTSHRDQLESRCKTSWLPMPAELDDAISRIDAIDGRGTFFRYPVGDNSLKSANKPISQEEISSWDRGTRGALRAFLLLDQNGELADSFHYVHNLLAEELEVLKTACKWLECLHVGLRMELAQGW